MHGDEGRAEDQQQDGHVDDAGRVSRRPQDQRGVPQLGPVEMRLEQRRSMRSG